MKQPKHPFKWKSGFSKYYSLWTCRENHGALVATVRGTGEGHNITFEHELHPEASVSGDLYNAKAYVEDKFKAEDIAGSVALDPDLETLELQQELKDCYVKSSGPTKITKGTLEVKHVYYKNPTPAVTDIMVKQVVKLTYGDTTLLIAGESVTISRVCKNG